MDKVFIGFRKDQNIIGCTWGTNLNEFANKKKKY